MNSVRLFFAMIFISFSLRAMETTIPNNSIISGTCAIGGDATSEIQNKIAALRGYLRNPSYKHLITGSDFEQGVEELIALEKKKALLLAQNANHKDITSVVFFEKNKLLKPDLLDEEFKDEVVSLCNEVISLDSYLTNPIFRRFESGSEQKEIQNRLFAGYFKLKALRMEGLMGVLSRRTYEVWHTTKRDNKPGPFDQPFELDNNKGVLCIPLEVNFDDLLPESTHQYSDEDLEILAESLNDCEKVLNKLMGNSSYPVSDEAPNDENNNNAN